MQLQIKPVAGTRGNSVSPYVASAASPHGVDNTFFAGDGATATVNQSECDVEAVTQMMGATRVTVSKQVAHSKTNYPVHSSLVIVKITSFCIAASAHQTSDLLQM